jgi:hypothetical protein
MSDITGVAAAVLKAPEVMPPIVTDGFRILQVTFIKIFDKGRVAAKQGCCKKPRETRPASSVLVGA